MSNRSAGAIHTIRGIAFMFKLTLIGSGSLIARIIIVIVRLEGEPAAAQVGRLELARDKHAHSASFWADEQIGSRLAIQGHEVLL